MNRTVEEVIIEFYGTDEFKNFAIKYEEDNAAFMKEKKFSFMENNLYYGFLKLKTYIKNIRGLGSIRNFSRGGWNQCFLYYS